jgi:hypothetical protein
MFLVFLVVVVVVLLLLLLVVAGWAGCPRLWDAGGRKSRNRALRIKNKKVVTIVCAGGQKSDGRAKNMSNKKRVAARRRLRIGSGLEEGEGEGENERLLAERKRSRYKGRRTVTGWQAARPKEGSWLDVHAGSRCTRDPVGSSSAPAADASGQAAQARAGRDEDLALGENRRNCSAGLDARCTGCSRDDAAQGWARRVQCARRPRWSPGTLAQTVLQANGQRRDASRAGEMIN